MATIEKVGKDIVQRGRGGEVRHKFKSEEEARSTLNRINFIRQNNEKNGGAEHVRERPIEVNTK